MATIHDPGKFEGETDFVRAMWDWTMEGGSPATIYDGETEISCFTITADDVAHYADDLSPDDIGKVLCLWESEQGFVNSEIRTQAEVDYAAKGVA